MAGLWILLTFVFPAGESPETPRTNSDYSEAEGRCINGSPTMYIPIMYMLECVMEDSE